MAEEGLHDLDDAWILATDETPIPYSPTLEDAFLPDADAIVASRAVTARRGGLNGHECRRPARSRAKPPAGAAGPLWVFTSLSR